MMTLKPYPAYKDADVGWFEPIPSHWQTRAAKRMLTEISDKGHPHLPLLAATQSMGVVRKDRYGQRTVLAMSNLESLKRVQVDDFVISLRSFQGGIERAYDEGILSSAYTVLRRNPALLDAGYLARLFKSKPFLGELELNVTGIREGQNINYGSLRESHLPLPPLDEQRAIAAFLDAMDARITRFIAARKKMIQLLEEKKQAVINQAVTKGLDPTVPLKDSGVDWLGEIPAHWDVMPVKRELRNLNTRRVPLSSTERGLMTTREYDYYGASGVIDKVDDYLFDGDYLLIAEDGANLVLRNLPLAIVAKGKFWVNNHAHILAPIAGVLDFYAGVLESVDYRPWISGAAQPKLTQDRLMNIEIPVPPVTEQRAIADHIRCETSRAQNIVARHRQEIELMQEYRTRLISDVVTGKLDVRGVELGELSEFEEVPNPDDGTDGVPVGTGVLHDDV